jgi:hypothetical protein
MKGRTMQVPHMIGIEEVDCEEMLAALLEDFVSNFEAVRHDRVFQQLMIAAPPVSTGSVFADGLIAAAAKYLATAYRLRVPAWVHDDWRAGPSGLSTMSDFLAGEADGKLPPDFCGRNVVGAWPRRLASGLDQHVEPLRRAVA